MDFDVPARMRDGTTLRADVYRPRGVGPWPTLLCRTPYGKHVLGEIAWSGLDPVQAARRGFLVVIQDTRGRFASDGEWQPFRFEASDGYDSIEWAAGLPGSTGRVGMYGGSYCGNTQWMPAIARPPSLLAMSPLMTWSEPMDGVFRRGGAVELGFVVWWSLLTALDDVPRSGLDATEMEQRHEAMIADWDRLGEEGYWGLPVSDIDVLRRHGVPPVGATGTVTDSHIAEWCRVADSWDAVELPTFHTAGWFDGFLEGTLENYNAMVARGRDARLVVGPWTHEILSDPIGERSFGIRAGRDGPQVHAHGDWNDLQLAWFRRHLVPGTEVELPDAPVRIFVMGRNEWRDESSWPPSGARYQRWFMTSAGSLTENAPDRDAQCSEFVYDPATPVPTVGGNLVMWPGYPAGPVDQARIESRGDVLVFSSEPLTRDFEVTGRVRVVLYAETSAPSTDWVARLCDVLPDGRSFNLCDGIRRARPPGRGAHRYEIDLWSTSNVFLRGHRIRVHVTSSSFPRWDRNLNTDRQTGPRMGVARQRILHDGRRSSYIELPIIT